MRLIRFPSFGLEFNISRIAFKIGDIIIYKYAVAIVLRNNCWTYFSKI